MEIKVKAIWDKSAKVWSASSEDVFGLFVEAGSLDDLATQLVHTFVDLWAYTDEPLPSEVIFEVECIKEQASLRSFNLNVQHVPHQVATA